jgi:hypothetical protein
LHVGRGLTDKPDEPDAHPEPIQRRRPGARIVRGQDERGGENDDQQGLGLEERQEHGLSAAAQLLAHHLVPAVLRPAQHAVEQQVRGEATSPDCSHAADDQPSAWIARTAERAERGR